MESYPISDVDEGYGTQHRPEFTSIWTELGLPSWWDLGEGYETQHSPEFTSIWTEPGSPSWWDLGKGYGTQHCLEFTSIWTEPGSPSWWDLGEGYGTQHRLEFTSIWTETGSPSWWDPGEGYGTQHRPEFTSIWTEPDSPSWWDLGEGYGAQYCLRGVTPMVEPVIPAKSTETTEPQGSNDPFLIHHSDSPSIVLVTPLLFAYCCIELSQWERCNDLVGSWILNSVSTEIRTSILYVDTAREIWLDLPERFSQTNAPLVYQLKQSIFETKQDNMLVSAYFTKLKFLWNELGSLTSIHPCTCGNGKTTADQLQQDRAMEYLPGLHERYAGLWSQILLMDPFMSTTKIYSLSSPIPDAAALVAKSANRGNDSKFRKNQLHYDHCGWNNHTKDCCYKLIGYPLKKSGAQSGGHAKPPKHKESEIGTPPPITQDQYNKLLALLSKGSIDFNANLASIALTVPTNSIWIIDT
ncbi:hypothetical protein RHSIM_Rhsim06G0180600 [Rhododendron simsii]|uniref:Retrotransposon gag domain-containing protein n=1 Tax=Rhododendron simsii TaxID=118357 RepID=A0A834GX32_RHOSS|nr:hypothetical protein RHSIM_Rhsim06G0180600 [Rhododendron simsii]